MTAPTTAKRKGKPRALLPASHRPHRCVILAIDAGKVSGWAIWVEGVLSCAGVATTPTDRQLAVTRAYAIAGLLERPLVVVGETWHGRMGKAKGGRIGVAVLIGMGAEFGRWREQLDMLRPGGVKSPPIVRVLSDDWQGRLLGRGTSAQLELRSRSRAAAMAAGVAELPDDHNACDAVCIGEWGARSGEVGKVLPAAFRAAA